MVDVLNEAGEKGLNIIFMFGHNHGGYFDNYVGSDCVYYEPGQEFYVTNPAGGTVNDFDKVTIHFTYMNAGYLGYVPSNGTLSSTVFAIYEDRVQIARYSADGLCNLKDVGSNSDYDCGWEADTWEVTSPQVLQLSDIILTVENSTLIDGLPIGGKAEIKIGITAPDTYSIEWVSEDTQVVSVAPHFDDPTVATLTAVGGGKTIVKAVVREETGASAALYFDVTVAPETATVFPDGAMWVEGSGQIEINGNGETGGFVAVLSNGKIDYVPITTEMLTGADFQTSGTYTCKVTYNGHTITDNYKLTVITIPGLKLVYPTLSFESEIFYNIYFTATNTEDVVQLGLLAFETVQTIPSVDDADYVTNALSFDDQSGYYKASTSGIPAKKLGDTLYFAAYAQLKDGRYIYSDIRSFSAATYASDRLKHSSSETMKALCVAMLNYGAAAQQYFNHNHDTLVNAELTDTQQSLVKDYDVSMVEPLIEVDTAKEGIFSFTASGYTQRYPSVSFEGAFGIHYYFTPGLQPEKGMTLYYWDWETYQNATVLTRDNAYGSIPMTATETGAYKGMVGNIAAKELDTTIFVAGLYEADGVQYATGVLPYSLGAYCADRAENGSVAMQLLAKATAVYGYYAKEYFNA